MKKLKSLFLLVGLVFLLNTVASADNGGIVYTLQMKNLEFLQSGAEVQFDLYLLNRTPLSVDFYYASSTYWIWINKNAIPAGGTLTGSTILAGNCELTNLLQKPNAVLYNTNSGDPTNRYHFRISGGSSTMTQSEASVISKTGDGTKICRVSLVCRVGGVITPFASMNSLFEFKLPPTGGPFYTSVFAYLTPGVTAFTNMTYPPAKVGLPYTDNTHIGLDIPLPVLLASFTGNVENKRDVTLNWKTATENNNRGFEIERKTTAGNWSKVGYLDGKGNSSAPVSYKFDDRKLNTGKYNYRLKQIDNNGNFEYHNLSTIIEVGVPTKYDISQNYPNPFNPTTKIDFDLPFDSKVSIVLYDLTGREVKTLVNNTITAGYYTEVFNLSSLSSGTYFYRFITESSGKQTVMTKKMLLVK